MFSNLRTQGYYTQFENVVLSGDEMLKCIDWVLTQHNIRRCKLTLRESYITFLFFFV
jgi:hypothetical protein